MCSITSLFTPHNHIISLSLSLSLSLPPLSLQLSLFEIEKHFRSCCSLCFFDCGKWAPPRRMPASEAVWLVAIVETLCVVRPPPLRLPLLLMLRPLPPLRAPYSC